jgi:HK97 family phage prohead protease
MRAEAERGLEWRREFGRGGTEVGVARARDISNGADLSMDTVRRMRSYFARHEVDKQGAGWSPGEDGFPSAGRIAWALWGGDPGRSWAEAIVEREQQDREVVMATESRTLPAKFAELRIADMGSDRWLEGYAAVWDTRSHNLGGFVETVRRSFFDEALAAPKLDVVGAPNHDMNAVVARTGAGLELSTDEIGLRYRMLLEPGDPVADRIARLVQRGVLKGSSFSFTVPAGGAGEKWSRTDQGYPLRELVSGARLFDVGPATVPAYPATESAGQLALRSLAVTRGLPLEEVLDAARRNELGDIIDGEPRVDDDEPASGQPASSPSANRSRRVHLLAARSAVR